MAYRVVRDFADAQDNGFLYRAGDNFPRTGKKLPKEERVKELSTCFNKIGVPLIVFAEEKPIVATPLEASTEEKPKRKRRVKSNDVADTN